MTGSWAEQVATAATTLVLPPGERRARLDPPGPLRLDALLPLGAGHGVAVVADASSARWTVPVVRDARGLRRSRPGDGTAERLVERLVERLSAPGVAPDGRFRVRAWRAEPVSGERAVTVDQTNESVVVGERAIVKWGIQLPARGEPGSPAGRRIAALAAAGFDAMPAAWGTLELAGDGEPPDGVLLATVVAFLPGALDGWDWAVGDLARSVRGELPLADAVAPAAVLGELTARLHVALAGAGSDPARPADLTRWRTTALAELAEATALVTGAEGARLRDRAPRIREHYDALLDVAGTPLIDCHGDLHVGQVLRHGGGYAITDFDGNPVESPRDRLARRPAAVDVVGMAASLDHVGRVVRHGGPAVAAGTVGRWTAAAQRTYLTHYRATLAEAGASELIDERLLLPLRLQQEVREHLYAVRHLPHWSYVPDRALADLLPEE